jgi:hypothetical protein
MLISSESWSKHNFKVWMGILSQNHQLCRRVGFILNDEYNEKIESKSFDFICRKLTNIIFGKLTILN